MVWYNTDIHVCITHTHARTHTHKHTQTDRHTCTHTGRQTDRQTHTHTHTDTDIIYTHTKHERPSPIRIVEEKNLLSFFSTSCVPALAERDLSLIFFLP